MELSTTELNSEIEILTYGSEIPKRRSQNGDPDPEISAWSLQTTPIVEPWTAVLTERRFENLTALCGISSTVFSKALKTE